MSVVAQGLVKAFAPGAPAVSNVSLDAPAGAVTALLGPSGSGKLTILRLIAGLETADAGKIAIDGRDVTQVPPAERHIGMVFQSYALFKHMSVSDNIGFGLSVRGAPRDEIKQRVSELLELVQLAGLERRFPSQLSGGQRQRVALARALATKPRVLLLDEPFGALDTQVRVELREWLRNLHKLTKVTTILVTHDQEEALELSDHVVLLHEGQVAQAGTPHQLYDAPASPFVARFLGGASMIAGKVEHGHAVVASQELDVKVPAADGSQLKAFIRPHDVRVSKIPDTDDGLAVGHVERIIRIGGYVKLVLTLADGDLLTVQMRKDELDTTEIVLGDRVAIHVRDAKVFVQDYAI